MDPTIRPDSRHWKSPDHSRGPGPRAVQAAYSSRSEGAAQKKISRTFAAAVSVAQILGLQGKTAPIIALIARLHEVIRIGPVAGVSEALVVVGKAERLEGESREGCHVGGYTRGELQLERKRILAVIDAAYAEVRAIDFRLGGLQ